MELYGSANYSRRTTDAPATWRTAYSSGTTLRSPLYPQGFLPIEAATSTDTAVVAGLRSKGDTWRWDTSVNYGSSEFNLDLQATANLSLGATSPTAFHAGQLKNTQTAWNLDVAREFDWLGARNPWTLAFGAESRNEDYRISAGEPNSYFGSGAQGFAGFQPSNAGSFSRSSWALYANVEGEVARDLSTSLALRHEDYSDFGSVTSGKLSGRYEVNNTLALRAALSNGFRAPSLAQQNYTISTTMPSSSTTCRSWWTPAPSASPPPPPRRWAPSRWSPSARAT